MSSAVVSSVPAHSSSVILLQTTVSEHLLFTILFEVPTFYLLELRTRFLRGNQKNREILNAKVSEGCFVL